MLNKGDKIGDYTLVEKIGSGGFGDVWKAEKRTALDVNFFALKFFRPKNDQVEFEKILKELSVWKKLRGLPHIISLIELDRFQDFVYIVSDYADGGSLEKWFEDNKNKTSSEDEAVEIVLQILIGLENLHEKGFVHRDLKPDNILIMNGKFCLADFGVSREMKTHSRASGTAGTMEYMPPEAFRKSPLITPQTDIWAVGVILQKLLTGGLPYPQDDQSSLMFSILQDKPEPMPESISPKLRKIVEKALQKDPADRFKSASEMRNALINPEQFLADQSKSQTIIDEDFDYEQIEKLLQTEKRPASETVEPERRDQLPQTEAVIELPQQKDLEESRPNAVRRQNPNSWKWILSGAGAVIGISVFLIIAALIFGGGEAGNESNRVSSNASGNAGNSSNSAVSYFNFAFNKCPAADFDCQISNYTKAVEINPEYASAYNNRGLAYYGKKEYEQAISDFNKAIELNSDYATAYYNRGLTYFGKGDYDQAVADNTKAIELKSDYGNAYITRGLAYERKDLDDQAAADFRQALQIDKNNQVAKENLELILQKKKSR